MLMGLAIGDFHADKLTKYWPEANDLQINAVATALDKGIREGCTHAFYLGDIAEGIRDSTGNAMRLSEGAQCKLLAHWLKYDKLIDQEIILGNHDWASAGSHSLGVFIAMQEAGVFQRTRFYPEMERRKINGIKTTFMPFPNVEPPSGTQLAFAHYEVSGAIGDNGRAVHSQELHDYGTTIIQGHLHTRQRVRNHYYPGTLYQTSFGESLPKGFMMFQQSRKFQQRWIEQTPPFKLINLRINKRSDFKQLTKDRYTLYKLFVHEDIVVPDSLMTDYPNVVNRLNFATAEEVEALEHEEFKNENQVIDLDHVAVLPKLLKRRGATPVQIERALQIMGDWRSSSNK